MIQRSNENYTPFVWVFIELSTAFRESDEAVKEKKFEELKKDTIPFYMEKLDAIAAENNGHLALGRVCIE